MADPRAYYRAALEAKRTGGPWPPIIDGQPQVGHYRRKQIDDTYVAASIFQNEGALVCCVGNDEMRDPVAEWVWLAKNPIEESVAFHFYQHGTWPGGPSTSAERAPAAVADAAGAVPTPASPPIGHNQPPKDLVVEMGEFAQGSADWLVKLKSRKLADDAQAQIATNKVGTLREFVSKATKAHRNEKEPWLVGGRAVDTKYNPTIKVCEALTGDLLRVLGAYGDAKKAAAEAEARRIEQERQRAEAQRQRLIDEAAAKNAPPPPEIELPPLPAAPEPMAPVKFTSHTGRAISMRKEPVLVLEDSAKLFGYYLGKPRLMLTSPPDPRLLEAAMVLARGDWKSSGVPPPGTRIDQISKAA